MKIALTDTLRKTIYYSTYCMALTKKEHFDGFILCYHSISDDKWDFSVTPEMFKRQIEFLLQNYQQFTLNDLEKYLDNKTTSSKPFFMVTFDDGYKNIMQIKDFVKSVNIKPVVFLLSNTENANRAELENNYEFLNDREIKDLKNEGWEFGSHGRSHEDQWKLTRQGLEEEVGKSKKTLENQLGFEIRAFAYPKGRYTQNSIDMVREAGYKVAFSMDSEILKSSVNKYIVPRVGVMNTHSFTEFKSMILPSSIRTRKLVAKYRENKHEK